MMLISASMRLLLLQPAGGCTRMLPRQSRGTISSVQLLFSAVRMVNVLELCRWVLWTERRTGFTKNWGLVIERFLVLAKFRRQNFEEKTPNAFSYKMRKYITPVVVAFRVKWLYTELVYSTRHCRRSCRYNYAGCLKFLEQCGVKNTVWSSWLL